MGIFMEPLIFFSIFFVLVITLFCVGLYASKTVKSNDDYFLAGRSLGVSAVTFTLIATQLGGNMLLGTAQKAYHFGYYGMVYALGISAGFLLLASGFAAKLRACNVATTAQIFETKYNSVFLKQVASAISIFSLCGVLISIVVASKTLMVSLGLANDLILVIFWLLIIGYTMIGGLRAVVLADTFQVVFIILSLGSVFFYSLIYQPHGFLSLTELYNAQPLFLNIELDGSMLLATFLIPVLFSLIEQDLAQRFFSAKSQRVAFLSALFAGIFMIVFGFVPVYFGMQAYATGMVVPVNGNPFISVLELITSDVVFAFVICGVLAAITSTADALLCAISSNVAQDFDFSFIPKRNKLRLSQGITLFTGLVAILSAYFIHQNILDIAIASCELSVSCLLIPIIVSFYKKDLNKNAAFGSALCGLIGFVLFRLFPVPMSKEVATLALSAIGYLIGNAIKN